MNTLDKPDEPSFFSTSGGKEKPGGARVIDVPGGPGRTGVLDEEPGAPGEAAEPGPSGEENVSGELTVSSEPCDAGDEWRPDEPGVLDKPIEPGRLTDPTEPPKLCEVEESRVTDEATVTDEPRVSGSLDKPTTCCVPWKSESSDGTRIPGKISESCPSGEVTPDCCAPGELDA